MWCRISIKISGPLLDRIDLQLEVPPVNPWDLSSNTHGEESSVVAKRVEKAIQFSQKRFEGTGILRNAEADGIFLTQHAHMEEDSLSILRDAAEKMRLSARGYHRIIRVARTIADMEFSDTIKKHHVYEALSFKNPLKSV